MKKSFLCVIGILLVVLIQGLAIAKNKTTVAVLPFSAHSAENIDYVQQGIWDMLSSRISADAKIEVSGKDAVNDALKGKPGKELAIADVYGIGKKMNVDYVVWGSITKIGSSLSIDGKLIDVSAGKAAVGVFAQCKGMDEVIPEINDFALKINNHILGTSIAVEQPVAPIISATPQQQPATGQEARLLEGMKTGKKGTFTGAVNPDFINALQPLNKKTFWMSQKVKAEFRGMDVGDVNGDGLNEVITIDVHNVYIYQKKDNAFKLLHQIKGKSYDTYLSVDVADTNRNGIKEIIVSSVNRTTPDSFILEWNDREKRYVEIASKLSWFLRVIDTPAYPATLLGQKYGMDKPFATPIHEIICSDGKYIEGRKMKIPLGLSVYGLTLDAIEVGGEPRVIALNEDDYLAIYQETDKPLDRSNVFGGSTELIYKSDENFGGSSTVVQNQSYVEEYEKNTFINLRILTYDMNKDGKREVVIVKNLSSSGRLLKNVKLFTAGEVHDLEWEGLGLTLNWKTRKINGYIADYQFKDIDNDGENEIVLALVLSTGASLTDKSIIVSYKMNPQGGQEQ